MVRQIGSRLVVKVDHVAEIDHWPLDLFVLAELAVGNQQIGKMMPRNTLTSPAMACGSSNAVMSSQPSSSNSRAGARSRDQDARGAVQGIREQIAALPGSARSAQHRAP